MAPSRDCWQWVLNIQHVGEGRHDALWGLGEVLGEDSEEELPKYFLWRSLLSFSSDIFTFSVNILTFSSKSFIVLS